MTTTLHVVHGLVPGKRDRTQPAHPERRDVVLPRPTGLRPSAASSSRPRTATVASAGSRTARRPDPPEAALAGCIEYLGRGAKAAIAVL